MEEEYSQVREVIRQDYTAYRYIQYALYDWALLLNTG